MDDGFDYYIRAGSSRSDMGGNIYELKRVILHPDFNATYQTNDISILELNKEIVYDENMSEIPMQDSNYILRVNIPVEIAKFGGLEINQFKNVELWKTKLLTSEFGTCKCVYPLINDKVFCVKDKNEKSTSNFSELKNFIYIYSKIHP